MTDEAHNGAGVGEDVAESDCVAVAIDDVAICSGCEIGVARA